MDVATPSSPAAREPAPRTLLCVDDEPNILASLRRVFRTQGYRMLTAGSGSEALQLLEREPVDVVISDMRMPGMDGAALLSEVRRRWPSTVRLLLTGRADMQSTIAAINGGEIRRYLAKPWNDDEMQLVVRDALERKSLEEETERLQQVTKDQNAQLLELNETLERRVAERTAELAEANAQLRTKFVTSIKVFAGLIEMRGGGLAGHSRRVADLARRMALQLALPDAAVQDVFIAGLLHDIGKIGFSDALLAQPAAKLTGGSLAEYRRHPATGEGALAPLVELRGVAAIVRSHHERVDGSGFPDGLARDAIPLGARILAVASEFDDLVTGTQTRVPSPPGDAVAALRRLAGRHFEAGAIDALERALADGPAAAGGDAVLQVSLLTPGMRLARDVLGRDGVLLLAADYVLNERLIRQLRNHEATEGVRLEVHVKRERNA